jgi:hypothetical protein
MKFSFKKLFKFLLVILFIWAIYVLFFRKIVEGKTMPAPPPTPYTKAQCSALSGDVCGQYTKNGCYVSYDQNNNKKCYGGK